MQTIIYDKYAALIKEKNKLEKELSSLPSGYISKKRINGYEYRYLQKRCNRKVTSQYISPEEAPGIEEKLNRRKLYQERHKNILMQLKEIEKEAFESNTAVSRKITAARLSSYVDKLGRTEKEICISFSETIVSLENVEISSETKDLIHEWLDNKVRYEDMLNITLKRYGFDKEI